MAYQMVVSYIEDDLVKFPLLPSDLREVELCTDWKKNELRGLCFQNCGSFIVTLLTSGFSLVLNAL